MGLWSSVRATCHDVHSRPLTKPTEENVFALQLWLIDYFYLIAGILFLLAGAFYCMHEISPWLLPGDCSFSLLCFMCPYLWAE